MPRLSACRPPFAGVGCPRGTRPPLVSVLFGAVIALSFALGDPASHRTAAATVGTPAGHAAPADGQEAADDGVQAGVLEAETALLEKRIELASSDVFHLFLDPTASELKLMFGGAVLQKYPVAAIEIGRPRIVFVVFSDAPPWQAVIWEHGTLVPPRPIEELAVRPPTPGAEELPPPVIPPTAEEAISVPLRYRIRFDGGLALEVVRQDGAAGGTWTRVRGRLREMTSMLRPSDRDTVRVRVVLDRSDAESLYRSLPPQSKLLIAYRR